MLLGESCTQFLLTLDGSSLISVQVYRMIRPGVCCSKYEYRSRTTYSVEVRDKAYFSLLVTSWSKHVFLYTTHQVSQLPLPDGMNELE